MAEHGFYRSSGAAWQRALPPELCRPDDREVLRRGWDLLALDREGARRLTARGGLRCRTLLLPQGVWTEPLAVRQAVSYGPSPQSTLTLSSLTRRGVLCVQRQVTALDGSVIEPQDIPLPEAWGCWETEPLLLLAGVCRCWGGCEKGKRKARRRRVFLFGEKLQEGEQSALRGFRRRARRCGRCAPHSPSPADRLWRRSR